MNLSYQYLYAFADTAAQGPSTDNVDRVVIGDLDTREPPLKDEGDGIVLSLI
jgi:hypothetical protein